MTHFDVLYYSLSSGASLKALLFQGGCVPVHPSVSANLHFLRGLLHGISALAVVILPSASLRWFPVAGFWIPFMANLMALNQ